MGHLENCDLEIEWKSHVHAVARKLSGGVCWLCKPIASFDIPT